jgi:hypothetical protein
MKPLFIILSVCTFLFWGCKKSTADYAYSGTLTGFDLKMNPCSGGVFLNTQNKIYHINELPSLSTNEFNNLQFPINIKFNGTATNTCVGLADDGYFTVTSYTF